MTRPIRQLGRLPQRAWPNLARGLPKISAETSLDRIVAEPATSDPEELELWTSVLFCMKLARALLSYGLPVHRVEESMHRLSEALGLEASWYVTPTGLIFSLSSEDDTYTRVLNVVPGFFDMERLTALHELVGRVERGELSPEDGTRRIDGILDKPARYGTGLEILAVGVIAAAAARLLGGNPLDLVVATGLGFLVGSLSPLGKRWAALDRLRPVVAALLVSLVAVLLSRAGLRVQPFVLLLAAIMTVLPGLTVAIGMMELASAHLVSGVARLAGAAVTFLQLAFGAAVGHRLGAALIVAEVPAPTQNLPPWTHAIAPFLAAFAFGILMKVRPRDWLWVLLTCGLAVFGSRVGGELFGAAVGAFVGAFLVGITSHLYGRMRDRPVIVLLVPGILMMVPGSIGFLSLSSLLADDPLEAVRTGFDVLMVATALSTGVFVATMAIPPHRTL